MNIHVYTSHHPTITKIRAVAGRQHGHTVVVIAAGLVGEAREGALREVLTDLEWAELVLLVQRVRRAATPLAERAM